MRASSIMTSLRVASPKRHRDYDPIELPTIKYKASKRKEWNPDPYSRMLHDDMFKKWDLKDEHN